MEHPTREEWMDYLYGEMDAKQRHRMSSHLKSCKTCREAVARWQSVMGKLDAWKVGTPHHARLFTMGRIRWAAAAAFMILLGTLLGMLLRTQPAGFPGQLPEQTLASIRTSVENAIRDDIEAELADLRSQAQSDLVESTRVAIDLSTENLKRLLADYVRVSETARAEERKALVALLQDIESRRSEDFGVLQRDILTLALLTDKELLRTNTNVAQLSRLDTDLQSNAKSNENSFQGRE